MLDCEICGEPMVLSPARYVALVKAGQRPRCRQNGCERFCGAKNPRRSRGAEVLAVERGGLLRIAVPVVKRGRKNGALAKLIVSSDSDWRYEASPDNG